ncbi:MAG: hypothetical protein KGJ40_03445 [candidate division NC10 bacterium]|nr:hypothetical protein [candidate division NC10 bacterium]
MIQTHPHKPKRCKAFAGQVHRMLWFVAVAALFSPVQLHAQDWTGTALTWSCSTIQAISNRATLQGIQAAINAAAASATSAVQDAKARYNAAQRARASASADWATNEAAIKQKVNNADADKARWQANINEKLLEWRASRDKITASTQALADVQQKQYQAQRDQLQKEIADETAKRDASQSDILDFRAWIQNRDQQLATDIAPLIDKGRQLQARIQDAQAAVDAASQDYNAAQATSDKVGMAAMALQDCIKAALQALDTPPPSQRGSTDGYDPRTDPGMGGGTPNIPGAMGAGQQFLGSAPWGAPQEPPTGSTTPPIAQPPAYTAPEPLPPSSPPPTAWTPPPPCGAPGYPPCAPGYTGPPSIQVPGQGLVPGATPPMGSSGPCLADCHPKPDGSGCDCPGTPVNPCGGGCPGGKC